MIFLFLYIKIMKRFKDFDLILEKSSLSKLNLNNKVINAIHKTIHMKYDEDIVPIYKKDLFTNYGAYLCIINFNINDWDLSDNEDEEDDILPYVAILIKERYYNHAIIFFRYDGSKRTEYISKSKIRKKLTEYKKLKIYGLNTFTDKDYAYYNRIIQNFNNTFNDTQIPKIKELLKHKEHKFREELSNDLLSDTSIDNIKIKFNKMLRLSDKIDKINKGINIFIYGDTLSVFLNLRNASLKEKATKLENEINKNGENTLLMMYSLYITKKIISYL